MTEARGVAAACGAWARGGAAAVPLPLRCLTRGLLPGHGRPWASGAHGGRGKGSEREAVRHLLRSARIAAELATGSGTACDGRMESMAIHVPTEPTAVVLSRWR